MGRAIRGAVWVGLVVVVSVVLTAGASAKTATVHCHSYKGGAAGLVDTFTQIAASGVSCGRAHEVLGTWANSGPGGTDLGFSCRARKAKAKDTFQVRCVQARKLITARDTQSDRR
jgi:hypothetical protein